LIREIDPRTDSVGYSKIGQQGNQHSRISVPDINFPDNYFPVVNIVVEEWHPKNAGMRFS
jgi:hypothetical protein